jgi:excisionase family DNA binding protein
MSHSTAAPAAAGRRYSTLADAATYLNVNQRTIRRLIADGVLTGYRLGGRLIRVDLDEVDQSMRPIPTVQRGT